MKKAPIQTGIKKNSLQYWTHIPQWDGLAIFILVFHYKIVLIISLLYNMDKKNAKKKKTPICENVFAEVLRGKS